MCRIRVSTTFKSHSCQYDRQNFFLVLHGTWYYTSGYGWWRCKWVTKTYVHYFVRRLSCNKCLFSHQILLIYQRMFLSRQPITFSEEQCPVDEQPKTEDSVRLSEESPSTCHTPGISGLTSDQGMELNYIDKVPNFFLRVLVACFNKLLKMFWPI